MSYLTKKDRVVIIGAVTRQPVGFYTIVHNADLPIRMKEDTQKNTIRPYTEIDEFIC